MTWFAEDYESSRRWHLDELEEKALKLRRHCGYLDEDALELFSLFNQIGVEVLPASDSEMGKARALADTQHGARITVTHRLFKDFQEGDPLARFELCHELGHLVLHRGASPKALAQGGNQSVRFIPSEWSVEGQAWQYSRAVLLPRNIFKYGLNGNELATFVGVPFQAVTDRLADIDKFEAARKLRSAPLEVRYLLKNEVACKAIESNRVSGNTAQENLKTLNVWNACEKLPGMDPALWRMSRGFLICWNDFNKSTHYGWTVDNGEARAITDSS